MHGLNIRISSAMKLTSDADRAKRRSTRSTGNWLAVLVFATGLATNFGTAALADGEDALLKPDTPKLDTTIPKSKMMLKGGVEHHEAGDTSNKLSTGASTSTAKIKANKFKFQTATAKPDRSKPLRSSINDGGNRLSAAAESGIGIIGVKFVLAFGRPPVINRVFPGTPAAQVGLRNNDVIVAVDGVPTFGLSKEEVYQMIIGSPGTPVTVSVSRNGDITARSMTRMDFNDLTDPMVRRDYLLNM